VWPIYSKGPLSLYFKYSSKLTCFSGFDHPSTLLGVWARRGPPRDKFDGVIDKTLCSERCLVNGGHHSAMEISMI
jgi:hypothetical protein